MADRTKMADITIRDNRAKSGEGEIEGDVASYDWLGDSYSFLLITLDTGYHISIRVKSILLFKK